MKNANIKQCHCSLIAECPNEQKAAMEIAIVPEVGQMKLDLYKPLYQHLQTTLPARILAINTTPSQSSNIRNVLDLSKDVATDLLYCVQQSQLTTVPLMFIAFNSGCIVVQELIALIHSNPRWQLLRKRLCGIVLLNAPRPPANSNELYTFQQQLQACILPQYRDLVSNLSSVVWIVASWSFLKSGSPELDTLAFDHAGTPNLDWPRSTSMPLVDHQVAAKIVSWLHGKATHHTNMRRIDHWTSVLTNAYHMTTSADVVVLRLHLNTCRTQSLWEGELILDGKITMKHSGTSLFECIPKLVRNYTSHLMKSNIQVEAPTKAAELARELLCWLLLKNHTDPNITAITIPASANPYELGGFQSEMIPITQLDDLQVAFDAWLALNEKLQLQAKPTLQHTDTWQKEVNKLKEHFIKSQPIKKPELVLSGPPKIGKSTTLNTLIGLDLLPCDMDVCTGCAVRLVGCTQDQQCVEIVFKGMIELLEEQKIFAGQLENYEGFFSSIARKTKAQLAPDELQLLNQFRDALLKDLLPIVPHSPQTETHLKLDSNNQLRSFLALCRSNTNSWPHGVNIKTVLRWDSSVTPPTWRLVLIFPKLTKSNVIAAKRFVALNSGPLPKLVEDVTINVCSPLLQHITLTDTPGLDTLVPDVHQRTLAAFARAQAAILLFWADPGEMGQTMQNYAKEIATAVKCADTFRVLPAHARIDDLFETYFKPTYFSSRQTLKPTVKTHRLMALFTQSTTTASNQTVSRKRAKFDVVEDNAENNDNNTSTTTNVNNNNDTNEDIDHFHKEHRNCQLQRLLEKYRNLLRCALSGASPRVDIPQNISAFSSIGLYRLWIDENPQEALTCLHHMVLLHMGDPLNHVLLDKPFLDVNSPLLEDALIEASGFVGLWVSLSDLIRERYYDQLFAAQARSLGQDICSRVSSLAHTLYLRKCEREAVPRKEDELRQLELVRQKYYNDIIHLVTASSALKSICDMKLQEMDKQLGHAMKTLIFDVLNDVENWINQFKKQSWWRLWASNTKDITTMFDTKCSGTAAEEVRKLLSKDTFEQLFLKSGLITELFPYPFNQHEVELLGPELLPLVPAITDIAIKPITLTARSLECCTAESFATVLTRAVHIQVGLFSGQDIPKLLHDLQLDLHKEADHIKDEAVAKVRERFLKLQEELQKFINQLWEYWAQITTHINGKALVLKTKQVTLEQEHEDQQLFMLLTQVMSFLADPKLYCSIRAHLTA